MQPRLENSRLRAHSLPMYVIYTRVPYTQPARRPATRPSAPRNGRVSGTAESAAAELVGRLNQRQPS